jgi:Protein of unknown function (DUF3617)
MRKTTVPLLMCALLSGHALAAGPMKPGLWEMTMKSDAMKYMPKISPEQMEQMRRMGIDVPQMQDGAMVTKACITKQMAENELLPGMEKNAMGCQSKNMQRNGNSYSVDVVCTGPEMTGEGRARGSFSSNESFTSTYDFKGTVQGLPVNQHAQSSGRWLSDDCGSVRPLSEIMPKR